MKKFLLFIFVFFLFLSNSFALLKDFDNPSKNGYQLGYRDNEHSDNINSTINEFCLDNGYSSADSYEYQSENNGKRVSYYDYINSGGWKTYKLNRGNPGQLVVKITCDDGNGNNQGGLMVNGNIGSGALDIITINNGKIYLEKDNFFYFFVVGLVIILLYRSIIFIFISSVKFGINLTKGKTYFKK